MTEADIEFYEKHKDYFVDALCEVDNSKQLTMIPKDIEIIYVVLVDKVRHVHHVKFQDVEELRWYEQDLLAYVTKLDDPIYTKDEDIT